MRHSFCTLLSELVKINGISDKKKKKKNKNNTRRWYGMGQDFKAKWEEEVGDNENQAVARELNHARQLTREWLIFVACSLVRHPRGPGSSTLDLLGLAAVRTAGRILQLKILRCHEYDVATWASDSDWSALIRETCCSYAGFVQHAINFPSK